MARVGKVKVYNEDGTLIRHGIAREDDFEAKVLFGLFKKSDVPKIFFSVVCVGFTAGGLWTDNQYHFKTIDSSVNDIKSAITDMRKENKDSDQRLWSAFIGYKKCENQAMVNCCKDTQIC